MPDSRTNPSVAVRLDLRIERVPNRLRRWRRWLTLACGVVPLVLVAILTWQGDPTIFLSRPVASSHEAAQADCKSCHRTPWQPLVRLASLDNEVRSVRDADCQQCHPQSKRDHNPFAMAKGVPDCAVCHQEHRGMTRLTERADEFCVKCHASFEKHPQFALHRHRPTDQPPTESDEMMYRHLLDIAERRGATSDAQHAKWIDKTALRFNHTEHLKPLNAVWNQHTDTDSSPSTVQLHCSDCHQPRADGAYMQPIVFEQHCQRCHPLRFSGKLSDRTLPHEAPEIIHGVLRDRLTVYARQHPAELVGSSLETPSRLPHKTSRPTSREIWNWVEDELRLIESNVFQVGPAADTVPTNNACQKCHLIETAETEESRGAGFHFQIVPPGIPARWLAHSRFDHGRHRDAACIDCHAVRHGAATEESTTVEDILIPKLEVCQNCHGAARRLPTERYGRKNCAECHQYHHDYESKIADDQSL